MASLKRDVETIVDKLCADHGCSAKLTKNGHWRVRRPGHQPVTMSRTPSDQRALANIRSDVRRYLGVNGI
jgi:hypothetical protein